ncbi:hypothetical protein AMTRI_Chr02g262210 [Amborella trichopoda]
MPKSIISDHDLVFISQFWQEFFWLQGMQLQMSSSYHPQTDGQTKVVNRCLETYLRCVTGDKPKHWVKWLSLAEWWCNTATHTSTRMSPYEVVYGQPPPAVIPYVTGATNVDVVDRSLLAREAVRRLLKPNLEGVRNCMKQQADRHHSEHEFEVGDLLYLHLQPYQQSTLAVRHAMKLSLRYYGPFPVIQRNWKGGTQWVLCAPSVPCILPQKEVR